MTDEPDDLYLGDPKYYTKLILENPPVKAKYVEKFVKLGGDKSDPDQIRAFFKSEEFLTLLCEDDYNLFAERYLNYTVKPHHVEWSELFQNNKYCVVLAPREHGKSAWLVGYILWNAYYRKKSNILIISSTIGQGKIILGGEFSIKEQLESNPKLASIYPTDYNRKWSETQIKLLNGVRVEVAGSDQGIRGRHPDLIILDDILSEENSGTRQAREKLVKHYSRVIVPMAKKNTQIILIGTAFHRNDLLFTLGGSSKYAFKRYQALNEDTGETLWPEKHSKESLLEYKNTYGSLSFQQEYQNNPMSEDLAYFTQSILDGCKDSSLTYQGAYNGPNQIHLGGDLSPPGGARKGDGDYTVYACLEHMPDESLHLLSFVRFRDTPESRDNFIEKQMAELSNMCLNFQVDHGYMEEVGFQAVYTKELIRRQTNLPVEGMPITAKGKRSKVAGIPYLRSLMEKGKIKFPYQTELDRIRTDLVIEEFLGVSYDENGKIGNMGYHDDIVTAIWMAVESTKTSGKPIFTIPYDRYATKSKNLHLPRFKIPRRPFHK